LIPIDISPAMQYNLAITVRGMIGIMHGRCSSGAPVGAVSAIGIVCKLWRLTFFLPDEHLTGLNISTPDWLNCCADHRIATLFP
jgi:hypothetical protein